MIKSGFSITIFFNRNAIMNLFDYKQHVFLGQQSTTINSLPSAARPHQPQGLAQYRLPVNQVFRSPEEVNIPLQQRRPQQQQQGHILRRFPQVRPDEEEYE